MVKTAINLYSVRELDEPMLDVLDRVADAGYDGVQFSGGLRDASPDDVATKLAETDLRPTAPHVGIDALEESLKPMYERYGEALGCDGAVVPHLGEEHFESVDAVERTAGRLTALASELRERGWRLHYHNHAHEFVELGDLTALERLAAESEDVALELDVGWALAGGVSPVELIENYGERIDLLHMKDVTLEDETPCEIGEGDVDMQSCVDAARRAGIEWLIYEHDIPEDPATSIETGETYLNSL